MEWKSVRRTIYLAVVGVRACRNVGITVQLLITYIAAQYDNMGPEVSFYLPIGL